MNSRFVPEMGGLVRESVSLADLLVLLRHSRDIVLQSSSSSSPSSLSISSPSSTSPFSSSNGSSLSHEAMTEVNRTRGILEKISISTWQCFHLASALHPHNAKALTDMLQVLVDEACIPVISQQTGGADGNFTSASGVTLYRKQCVGANENNSKHSLSTRQRQRLGDDYTTALRVETARKIVIMIDDCAIFERLRVILEERSLTDINWVDGRCIHENISRSVDHTISMREADPFKYDSHISALERNTQLFLSMNPAHIMEFSTPVPSTADAPESPSALYGYLGIPSLSGLFSETWLVEDGYDGSPYPSITPSRRAIINARTRARKGIGRARASESESVSASSLSHQVVTNLHSMVKIVRKILWKEGLTLQSTSGISSIVDLKVMECDRLDRILSMENLELIPDLGSAYDNISFSISVPYHWEWYGDSPLLVNRSISMVDLTEMCRAIFMVPLRREIAPLLENRNDRVMFDILACIDNLPWSNLVKNREIEPTAQAAQSSVEQAAVIAEQKPIKTPRLRPPPLPLLSKVSAVPIRDKVKVTGAEPIMRPGTDLGPEIPPVPERNLMTAVKNRAEIENKTLSQAPSTKTPLSERERIGKMRESMLLRKLLGLEEESAIHNTDDTKRLSNLLAVKDFSTVAVIAPTGLSGELIQYPISDQEAPLEPALHHACMGRKGGGHPTGQRDGQGQGQGQNSSVTGTPLQLNFHAVNGAHFEKQSTAKLRNQECLDPNSLTRRKTTGRIGEFMAYELLVSNMTKLRLSSVEWINRNHETTEPFDIVVRTIEGFARFCEVKTTHRNHGNNTQWPISKREVCTAVNKGQQYFAMCLRISSLPLSRAGEQQAYHLEEAHIVGWECGLAQGLYDNEACLLLQIGGGTLTLKAQQNIQY
jgi:Domain of unknown function (DUF3883)